ncbi:sensor histidine kinase [Virgibacillus profundi]|uniref:histidine kinase n=1 Tax=Virgibacillus profundi TaxID=2024555 RepID=A0A2A2IER2_9BACI|nr:LytS/YhcK type 5TM receptor domain-containing protein [Virgibacillus profundi]PAV29640.1 sensor histidine kinase [Virgibacillus profundi]PXY53812.1 sensor histidine kinase [Virgibacillus profundi]
MKDLTIILFERLGLLLVIAFVMTRTPGFKSMLYREFSWKMSIVHALVFGIFAVASTVNGIIITGESAISRDFVIYPVENNQMIVSSSLVAVVIAGLLGGPIVGLGAGLIAGGHLIFLGGIGSLANGLVNPLTGLLAGMTARFFSNERVISPFKALFIGVFPPVLQMQLLLIIHTDTGNMVEIVDRIGLPLVLSNSIAIAIFTAMIGIVLSEQENEAALASRKALTIAEEAMPYLKKDSPSEMAKGIAKLLYDRLELAAVSVTNHQEVLAHIGLGAEHHQPGEQVTRPLSLEAIETNKMKVAYNRTELQCKHEDCPLEAAIMIPIIGVNDFSGLITFYFRKAQHISPVELMMAQGLGQFISNQLNILTAEKLKTHIRDAELRNLQAQINPHFLFNTLQLIASLFRENPKTARRITLQLASYMRFNLRLVSRSLVELEKECEHVESYTSIIQERFAGRLQIDFIRPDDVTDIYIPPSTIQPLVENCIQHGLKDVADNGRVEILIRRLERTVHIAVRDNGCGFPESILDLVSHIPLSDIKNGGTGIYNVNKRLISLLGESAKLDIRNLPEGGSEVLFSIPEQIQMERQAVT